MRKAWEETTKKAKKSIKDKGKTETTDSQGGRKKMQGQSISSYHESIYGSINKEEEIDVEIRV